MNQANREITDGAFDVDETQFSKKLRFPKTIRDRVFPPYNQKLYSDANTVSMQWANNDDVEVGTRALIPFDNNWYVIEKYETAPNGYYIEERLTKKEYERYVEYERIDERGTIQTVQRLSTDFGRTQNNFNPKQSGGNASSQKTNAAGGVSALGIKSNEQAGRTASDGNRNNERGGKDLSRETNRISDSESKTRFSKKLSFTNDEYMRLAENTPFGEAIIELDDLSKTTLGAPVTFAMVKDKRTNPEATRIIRTDFSKRFDATDLKNIRGCFENGNADYGYFELYVKSELATEYTRNDFSDYSEYVAENSTGRNEAGNSKSSGNGDNRNNQVFNNGRGDYFQSSENGELTDDDTLGEATKYSRKLTFTREDITTENAEMRDEADWTTAMRSCSLTETVIFRTQKK